MTTTKTADVDATVAQIKRLEKLGCDIIRVAVPDVESANAIGEIKKHIAIPLVADIHFDHKLALRAIEAGADKIRINPGNIGTGTSDGGKSGVKAIADACNQKGIPIRVGVNGGSLEKEILRKHGGVTPEAMVESTMNQVLLLNKFDFDNIWIAAKSSNVPLTVKTYRLLHEQTNYPLHIGITEAGTEYNGIIKNSIGIGALLLDGIGDTIRVSLTAEPEREIIAGKMILTALGLRPGIDIISCPTCGRCNIDVIGITSEVEKRLQGLQTDGSSGIRSQPDSSSGMRNQADGSSGMRSQAAHSNITIAIMGCAVNGPGEAKQADFGISGSDREGMIFAKGEIIKKAPMENLVDELFAIIDFTQRGE